MFEKKIDIADLILGLLLAVFIIYMFWKWLEKGYIQWDKWDRSILSPEQEKKKEKRLFYFMTPNRWLADTVQPVSFWMAYYRIKYGDYIPI